MKVVWTAGHSCFPWLKTFNERPWRYGPMLLDEGQTFSVNGKSFSYIVPYNTSIWKADIRRWTSVRRSVVYTERTYRWSDYWSPSEAVFLLLRPYKSSYALTGWDASMPVDCYCFVAGLARGIFGNDVAALVSLFVGRMTFANTEHSCVEGQACLPDRSSFEKSELECVKNESPCSNRPKQAPQCPLQPPASVKRDRHARDKFMKEKRLRKTRKTAQKRSQANKKRKCPKDNRRRRRSRKHEVVLLQDEAFWTNSWHAFCHFCEYCHRCLKCRECDGGYYDYHTENDYPCYFGRHGHWSFSYWDYRFGVVPCSKPAPACTGETISFDFWLKGITTPLARRRKARRKTKNPASKNRKRGDLLEAWGFVDVRKIKIEEPLT